MKRIYSYTLGMMVALLCLSACNNEWEDEQYQHYISFKAPMNYSQGTTEIYVRYKPEGKVRYILPLIMSGSTFTDNDLHVRVGLDADTLSFINKDHFYQRTDLYYKELDPSYYELESTDVTIPGGDCYGYLPIDFSLKGIDLVEKWVLPLRIQDDPAGSYFPHPRKNYSQAILRVMPFNDYSGSYSSTSMEVFMGTDRTNSVTMNTRTMSVVDDKAVFFYAGLTEEDLTTSQRRKYKVIVRFNDDGTLTLSGEDPDIHFKQIGKASYTVSEKMDETQPYLKHRYVTLYLEYEYDDVTSVPGETLHFYSKGSMIMERKINTQIPDEDQAIQW